MEIERLEESEQIKQLVDFCYKHDTTKPYEYLSRRGICIFFNGPEVTDVTEFRISLRCDSEFIQLLQNNENLLEKFGLIRSSSVDFYKYIEYRFLSSTIFQAVRLFRKIK